MLVFQLIYLYWFILYVLLVFLDNLLIIGNIIHRSSIGSYSKVGIDILGIYECGFLSYYNILSLSRFNKRYFIRYYIVCIMYLLFDIELIYLYPLCIYLSNNLELSVWIYNSNIIILILLVLLFIGLVVEIEGV